MTTELEALALQANAIDGDLIAAGPEAMMAAQKEAEAVTLADGNGAAVALILGTAVPILSKLYPSLADVYTQEACAAIAGSVGPVLAKYNVDLSQWGGRYKEEIGAAIVCGPIAWATVQGVKADIEARMAASAPPRGEVGRVLGATAPPVQQAAPALMPGDYGYVEPV